ncbi:MAG: hypothetical protein Q9165_008129 [Trypethelium subeluteriae]
MAQHIERRRDASQQQPNVASSPSSPLSPQSGQAREYFTNPPQTFQRPIRSPRSTEFPQSPGHSLDSKSPQSPTQLPRAQPPPGNQPFKHSGVPSKSRFSDFSVDSEETRIRALYQRITAAQPISYKSVFVDVEEKDEPRPSGIRLKWWLFELLAWTLSLATLCALVLLLHQYNGKKQNEWPSRLFTLSALVALIATLTRVSLIIPIAQAISQAKWDWFSNNGKHEVQSGKPLGDLEVFDNASRFDTFSQQAFVIDDRLGNSQKFCNGVPRAIMYQDVTSNSGITGLDVSAKAAINSGILSANVTPVTASCPTGDCSWPTTPTIGVCGACIDISQELGTPALETNAQGQPQVLTISEGSKYILNSSAVGNSSVDVIIADFNIVGSQNQALADPVVTECALWFCMQAVDVKQEAGVQSITVSQISNGASTPSDSSGSFTFTAVPESFHTTFYSNFTVTKSTVDAYASYVVASINGSVTSSSSGYSPSSDAAGAIWLYIADLDSWIQRVATSMTNHIRLVGSSSVLASDNKVEIQGYDGMAYEIGSFIKVRWIWVSFPAAMVLLSLLYLVATMVHASRSGTHVWKSNPLPLVLVDVDPSVKMQADRGIHEPGGLKRAAGNRKVSLNGEDGRWVFRATEGLPMVR